VSVDQDCVPGDAGDLSVGDGAGRLRHAGGGDCNERDSRERETGEGSELRQAIVLPRMV
jgi:hypothetical protein